MIEEEDTEVILEGGELYRYLESQGTTIEDVYSSSSKQAAEPKFSTENFSNVNSFVPDEILNIVNMILKSDLLLEEDASYLFKRFSELLPQTQRRIPYKLIIPGMIIGISAYGYWKFGLRKVCTSIIACNTVYLFSGISNLFNHLKQREKIKRILSDLKHITTYIRKNIKVVQEEDSLIYSKEKVQQLRNDVNVINEHTLSRKKLEIFIICQKLIQILKNLILLSRNITLTILKMQGQKSLECNLSYIALYSDEQLGINKYGEEVDEETNVLPYIDVLRNVYLLIQSETLREFGLYSCGLKNAKEILSLNDLLNQYRSKSSEILLGLKQIYNKHFYPSFLPKKVKSVNKNMKYLGNIINIISSSLNSLLIDSRNLENFIDENTDEIDLDSSQNIGLKLLNMEREVAYLTQYIHTSAQQFLKKNNYFNQNLSQISPKSEERIIKTECMVGTSDFSVSGQDEVFLGLVEGSENIKNDDYIAEYEKPAGLGILLNELKSALITKREEFERREINALKSLEDIQNYKLCTSESSKICVSKIESNSIQNNKSYASGSSKISVIPKTESNSTQCASSSKYEFPEEVRSAIPSDKDLAIKASHFLKSWNKNTTGECFGDEIDDDDD
ncbi:unnamed protein product [Nezara viridula]|uniref:Uncharacterized protein n=1 Tax=Nezara viridula TaxID=85310 RepID=A0A9P0H0Q5_NEZVI|nr:unnamed protein product [Nezara viridula]